MLLKAFGNREKNKPKGFVQISFWHLLSESSGQLNDRYTQLCIAPQWRHPSYFLTLVKPNKHSLCPWRWWPRRKSGCPLSQEPTATHPAPKSSCGMAMSCTEVRLFLDVTPGLTFLQKLTSLANQQVKGLTYLHLWFNVTWMGNLSNSLWSHFLRCSGYKSHSFKYSSFHV